VGKATRTGSHILKRIVGAPQQTSIQCLLTFVQLNFRSRYQIRGSHYQHVEPRIHEIIHKNRTANATSSTQAAKMSTTPLDPSKRSNSRSRTSRPTTPLRPSSRSSFRESARGAGEHDAPFPLNAFEPAFAELSDAMADLEANMMHFQLMHESLARFSESFASFLYGLNMNAFCVDFPEVCLSKLSVSDTYGVVILRLVLAGTCSRILPQRQNSTRTTGRDPIQIRR
jgi:DASH complex subunit DAM1